MSVLFGASLFPPQVWTIDYYAEETNLFTPMVVIIAGNTTLCSNWSAYPTCHMTQTNDGNFIEVKFRIALLKGDMILFISNFSG